MPFAVIPDFLPILLAFGLFALFLIVPGYALAYAADVFGFRKQPGAARLALSFAVSMACCPILSYTLARLGGFRLVWIAYALLWAAAAAIAVRSFRTPVRANWKLGAAVALWAVAGALLLGDVVLGGGVYRNGTTGDENTHVAVIDAITHSGVPPEHPGFHPGRPVRLFYYYFWFLLCSLVDQSGMGALTSHAVDEAGKLWVGMGLALLLYLYLRFQRQRIFPAGLEPSPRALWGALFLITGLDLIPVSLLVLVGQLRHGGPLLPGTLSLEHWNDDEVSAWLNVSFMAPHHVAGLLGCLVGILLVHELLETPPGRQRKILVALAGAAFASAAGMSVLVTLSVAVGMALWFGFMLLRRRADVPPLAAVGILAALLILPFVFELRSASYMQGPALQLTVRSFLPLDWWAASLFHIPEGGIRYVLRFLLLPVNYGFELGFFLFGAFVYWRRRLRQREPLSRHEALIAALVAGSMLLCTFIKSTMGFNDLGWRGFLIAQFGLLLWSVPATEWLLARRIERAIVARVLAAALLLGAAGSLCEIAWLRVTFFGVRGEESLAWRDAYRWLDRNTPGDIRIVYNPDIRIESSNSLYGRRAAVLAGQVLGKVIVSDAMFNELYAQVMPIFDGTLDWDGVRSRCRKLGAAAVVVKSRDPVWKRPDGWIWRASPAFTNAHVRVYHVYARDLKEVSTHGQ